MAKRKYPSNAFVFTPNMLVKQVTLVKEGYWNNYHRVESGKQYHDTELHDTREAAIHAGELVLADQRQRVSKQLASIRKRENNLAKAKQEL